MKKIIITMIIFLLMVYTVNAVDSIVSTNKTFYTNGCISVGGACGNQLDSGNHLNLGDGFFVINYASDDTHAWYPPANAVSWAYIDLEDIYDITRIDLEEAQYGSNPALKDREIVYALDYSEDNVTWQTLFIGHDLRDGALTNDSNIVSITAQYVRVNITAYESTFGRVDELTIVGSLSVPPVTSINYNITLNKSVENINVSTVQTINFTAIIYSDNETGYNTSNNTGAYTELNYKIVTGLNECAEYTQKECTKQNNTYTTMNMTKILNNSFYSILSDTQIFPAYYPFDKNFIRNNLGLNYSVDVNSLVKFNIFNMSISTENYLISLEIDALNDTGSQSLGIYYCNSSYITGNPSTKNTCELVDNFNGESSKHFHPPFSNHFTIPYQVQNIAKTQISYIIFDTQSNPTNAWLFRYVTNISYDNTSFSTGNGISWDNSSNIFDIHLHQYLDTDYITAYAKYYDNLSNNNISNIILDYYDYIAQPPSATDFIIPDCGNSSTYTFTVTNETNTTIPFEWLESFSVNNESITYDLYLYKNIYSKTLLTANNSNLTFNFSTNSNYLSGNYYIQIYSCDSINLCDNHIHECQLNLCQNSYKRTTESCLNNIRLINYTDENSCSEQYNLPSDTELYEDCQSPAQKIDFTINAELYFHIIIILLMLLFLRIGIMSEGKVKGMMSISGVLFIIYGIIFSLYIYNDLNINVTYYFIANITTALFILIGVLLTILGIMALIENDSSGK